MTAQGKVVRRESAEAVGRRPKLLVTGANGFVGAALVARARSDGWTVRGMTRLGQSAASPNAVEVRSMQDVSALTVLLRTEEPDCVVHCVGSASVHDSQSQPWDDHVANTHTFHVLLESVRQAQIRPRVLLISSAAVYGNPASLPVPEDARAAPLSPYGFHKLAAELLVTEYSQCFALQASALRVFSLLGPGQRRLLAYEIAMQALTGDVVRLRGTGAETRDFLFIDDLADAILGLLRLKEFPTGAPINVASGTETSVTEMVEAVASVLGKDLQVEYQGVVRPEEPRRWRADTERLRAHLPGWQPRGLDAALQLCLQAWSREVAAGLPRPDEG